MCINVDAASVDELKRYIQTCSAEELKALAQQLGLKTEEPGLAGACTACPFNDGVTEEATEAQNLGCLPSSWDIMEMKRKSGHNWACHDDESRICTGFCHRAKEEGLSVTSGNLIRYVTWYHEGEAAAITEAANR